MSKLKLDSVSENQPSIDLLLGALNPKSEFYTPKEVLETFLLHIDNLTTENKIANHLMVLAVALSKSHLLSQSQQSKFYQDLYLLCQSHTSYRTKVRKK